MPPDYKIHYLAQPISHQAEHTCSAGQSPAGVGGAFTADRQTVRITIEKNRKEKKEEQEKRGGACFKVGEV